MTSQNVVLDKSDRPAAGSNSGQRLAGLDSLRFIAAIWVVFAHLGFLPILDLFDQTQPHGKLLRGIIGNMFAGPPAVVVFFVISGFCIHYPFRNTDRPPFLRYLARRYIRIAVPALLGWLFIEKLAPGNDAMHLSASSNTVVWSLVAEAIYYTIYPLLFQLRRRFGWNRVFAGAGCLALGVILSRPTARYFNTYGPWLTWVVGLPCWLLGCWLAEQFVVGLKRADGVGHIWCWRIGVWFLASLSSVLMFHGGPGYPWTLNAFAVVCVMWLRKELDYHATWGAWAWLEWAGQRSYSIYILHIAIPDMFFRFRPVGLDPRLDWIVTMIVMFLVCYAFYLVVEKPSHQLARRIRLSPPFAGLR